MCVRLLTYQLSSTHLMFTCQPDIVEMERAAVEMEVFELVGMVEIVEIVGMETVETLEFVEVFDIAEIVGIADLEIADSEIVDLEILNNKYRKIRHAIDQIIGISNCESSKMLSP